MTKRLATGELVFKHIRVDGDGEVRTNSARQPVGLALGTSRRRPILTNHNAASSELKRKVRKSKGSKKSVLQAIGKGVEKYELMNNLAPASANISFRQIARGYACKIRKDLRMVLIGTMMRSFLNMVSEDEEKFIPPKRHQLVMLTVQSEPVYALLDSGAIPDILSEHLAKKLKLEIESTDRSIIVAN